MKDFYKILGVNEDASEEEIRERWIELTKQYHPDRGEESVSDEKIKEINEAYQVLKHSSTRVEYDLKRTFNHRDRRRKGTFHFKRWGVPASISIILIIVGLIYIKNFETNQIKQINQTNLSREMPLGLLSHRGQINQKDQRDQKDQINQRNQISEKNQIDEKDQTDKRNEINQTNQINQTDQINQRNQRNEKDQRNQRDQKNERNQKNQTITSSIAPATMKKVQLPQPPQNRITPLPNDPVANKPTPSINKTDQKDQMTRRVDFNSLLCFILYKYNFWL